MTTDQTQETRRVIRRRRGCMWMMGLLILLLSVGFAGISTVVLFRPDVVGLALNGDVTATAVSLGRTAQALEATQDTLITRAANIASTDAAFVARSFDQESTQAALENYESLLYRLATQDARDAIATQTTVAIANAQQATQAALEFEATQAAFDRIATQVELEYQGTQAALNREATAAVLGFSTRAPAGQDIQTQTVEPTITAQPLFTDGFQGGLQAGLWQFGASADWTLAGDDTLAASRNGSWLLTRNNNLRDYTLNVSLSPLVGTGFAADYFILLNIQPEMDANGGLAVRLSYDGERLTAVGLYRIRRADILDDLGLFDSISGMAALQAVQTSIAPDPMLDVRVSVNEGRVTVTTNGVLSLDVPLDSAPLPGAVGLQVPEGARLREVTLAG